MKLYGFGATTFHGCHTLRVKSILIESESTTLTFLRTKFPFAQLITITKTSELQSNELAERCAKIGYHGLQVHYTLKITKEV